MAEAGEYYQDKVAVVTCGTSSIGLALAEEMLVLGTWKGRPRRFQRRQSRARSRAAPEED